MPNVTKVFGERVALIFWNLPMAATYEMCKTGTQHNK